MTGSTERERLAAAHDGRADWYTWGPYPAERQWATVREDYSANGDAWNYFPHDHARSRAYRWGEDGLFGLSDDRARLCLALALWNGVDPIVKERLYGLANDEGNHGEDVKEYYFFLDGTPTHSYLKALYKYPQAAFPYEALIEQNRARNRLQPEYELVDTGVFDQQRYWDVVVEYAKAAPHDILMRIEAFNRGPVPATLHVLPAVWFRNTWSWGYDAERPQLASIGPLLVEARHTQLGTYQLAVDGGAELLFTDNDTNARRLWNAADSSQFVTDGINDRIVSGGSTANPAQRGTRLSVHWTRTVAAGDSTVVRLRLSDHLPHDAFADFDAVVSARRQEADDYHRSLLPQDTSDEHRQVHRQAVAGLIWSKQFYLYDVVEWLRGDPAGPTPAPQRQAGRNNTWRQLRAADVVSMPDTWEYPWFAAWDLAFQCIPWVLVDAPFAKQQLLLLLREWYMNPSGQVPAYEWVFGDVNPPVQAWAAWRVYQIDRRLKGTGDTDFLERAFHKLLLNFTWWVNRKDTEGSDVFGGGFLGLDNISIFDRSHPVPGGGELEQADGTAWMGMFCLNMLAIAIELALSLPAYEDIAIKFFDHFLYIAQALNGLGHGGVPLWDENDEFFYDVVRTPDGQVRKLRVRSLVGLIPLLAVETIEASVLERLPNFAARLRWFTENRPDLVGLVSRFGESGPGRYTDNPTNERRLLALLRAQRMKAVLRYMLDADEFLSDHGIRSLSRFHLDHPYSDSFGGTEWSIGYAPAESQTGAFGGNSNWRGPVWFPPNFLLIEALQKFHHYYGDDFLVEYPTGSAPQSLRVIARDLSARLTSLFLRNAQGQRPVLGDVGLFQRDAQWSDYLPFHEYFHGDTGRGLGASHQTGWTALVAKLIDQQARDADIQW